VSAGTYLLGVLVLAALVVPVCLGARALRVRFLPDWSGPPALLATSVLAVALLELAAQLAGTFGLLHRVPLILVVIGSCVAIVALARMARPMRARPTSSPSSTRLNTRRNSTLVAALVVMAVALPWVARTINQLRSGVGGYDSLDYHLPFAGRFFETGRVTTLYYTFPGLDTAFDPVNDELIHAIGMVATQRDVLSPLLNLGWLALALLAAWSAHRRRAVQIMSVAAVGVLLSPPLFVSFSGGRATNDIAAIALFLASIALLLNGRGRRAVVAVAAVAAGLALGTKLTMPVPVGALTVGVIAVGAAKSRRSTALVWLPLVLLTGGYWYLRNLITLGNPIPALQVGLGPVSLPSTTDTSAPYGSYSVVHYLTNFGVWRDWFIPGLRQQFGLAYPIILGLAAAGLILAVVRGDRIVRMLGIVGIVSFIGYLATPQSAGGASGRPVLFASDTRFAFPALAIGMLVLPRLVRRPSTESPARMWLPALLTIALVSDVAYAFNAGTAQSALAALFEIVALAVVIGLALVWATRSPRSFVIAGCVLLLAGVAGGYLVERSYMKNRYEDVAHNLPYGSAPRDELVAIDDWVRGVSNARIALNGLGVSYPLFGADLSNKVQYVAHRGPHGAFDEVTSCAEWRRLLNDGQYDYVVISPDSRSQAEPPTAAWTRSDPAAQQIVRSGKASVFRVKGTFDPSSCPQS
jgi:hypothetical protein